MASGILGLNMQELLAVVFAMPTLPWTCLVIAALVYWVTVIVGALDIDVLGGADAHGGAAHGAEGGGDLHGGHDVPHGDAGHAGGADAHPEADGALTSMMNFLRLRSVPVTISLSLLGLFGWVFSFFLVRHLVPELPIPSWLVLLLETALTFVVALGATSLAIRPLAPLFRARSAPRHTELVGKVVRITTGRVDGRFGEGHLHDGGAGLNLQVRCADPDALSRDDEALILAWDAESQSFEVEPMSRIERPRSAATSE